MNVNDILSGDPSSDATSLLPDISSAITDILAPILWLSTIITIVFVSLYIYSVVRRRRLEGALFDIQKNIAEMNERDKARSTPPPPPVPRKQPQARPESETLIAQTDEPKYQD